MAHFTWGRELPAKAGKKKPMVLFHSVIAPEPMVDFTSTAILTVRNFHAFQATTGKSGGPDAPCHPSTGEKPRNIVLLLDRPFLPITMHL
jgi:hypothetical protein